MHIKKFVIGLMPCLFVSSALATTAPKRVMLPFTDVPIISSEYDGLEFNYDLNNPTRKVVCNLSRVYKSWMEFSDQGSMRESGVFGDSHNVIFTAKGKSGEIGDDMSIYHADAKGKIRINDVDLNDDEDDDANQGLASCHYENE